MFNLPIEITTQIIGHLDTVSLHRFSTTCVHIPEYGLTMEKLTHNEWKDRVLLFTKKIYRTILSDRSGNIFHYRLESLINWVFASGDHNWRKVYLFLLTFEKMINEHMEWKKKKLSASKEFSNWEFDELSIMDRETNLLAYVRDHFTQI